MSMLECFLKLELDNNGNVLPIEQKENNKLFLGGQIILDSATNESRQILPLKIAQHTNIVKKYQGRYPVISISFKEVKGDSYDELEKKMKTQLSKLFEAHSYLLEHLTTGINRHIFNSYINKICDYDNITDSLYFLSKLLHKHHGKKVDEYDATINEAYIKLKDKDPDSFEKVLDMFRGMLGASLKSNEHLERGLLTGILRISKANLLSGVNNLAEYNLLNEEFNECYGFTEDELDNLLELVPVDTPRQKIKEWYNGYNFGGVTIYNPWSIMMCLSRRGNLAQYWIDTGGTGMIDKAFVSDYVQGDLQKLIKGGSITYTVLNHIQFDDLDTPLGLYSLLLFAGYLNVKSVVDQEENLYELSIPNYEVKHIYKRRLLDWLVLKLGTTTALYETCMNSLVKGELNVFKDKLGEFLENSTSFYQRRGRVSELFYNGFILGMVSSLESRFILESEEESGQGRADLIIVPKTTTNLTQAIIIEYKITKDANASLRELALEGLKQIDSKGYDTKIKRYKHITSIAKVSIAFYDNNVEIEYQVDSMN